MRQSKFIKRIICTSNPFASEHIKSQENDDCPTVIMDPLNRKREIFTLLMDEWKWVMSDMNVEEIWKMRADMIFKIDTEIIPHICNWPKKTSHILRNKKAVDNGGDAPLIRIFIWKWLFFNKGCSVVHDI